MGWARKLQPLDWIVAGAAVVSLVVLGLEWRRSERRTAAVWEQAVDEG